jgi:Cu/Ag efflux protein CusF
MKFTNLFAAIGLVFSAAASAQTSTADHTAHHVPAAASSAPAAAAMTDGEVRNVDKEQGKVTLRHGPIANLDMPGMTMVFKVADAKMLDTIKQGDKVRFAADKVNGAITVTAIEPAK